MVGLNNLEKAPGKMPCAFFDFKDGITGSSFAPYQPSLQSR